MNAPPPVAPEPLRLARQRAAQHGDESGSWLALAAIAEATGHPEEAREALQRAGALELRRILAQPADVSAHVAKARIDFRRGDFAAACAGFGRALRLEPGNAAARLGLVKASLPLGRWEALRDFDPATVPNLVAAGEADPSNLIAIPCAHTGPALRAAGAAAVAWLPRAASPPTAPVPRSPGPLRVGYVSPDFNDHAVAHQVVRTFENHLRSEFHVVAYDIGHDDGSAIRRRLLAACGEVRDCRQRSAAAIAAAIRADRIDVLVDLAGHTLGSMPAIFAHRPAPVQVAWLGYPASTGLPWIDYLIADPIVAPASARSHFSESLALLPGCYLPADDRQPIGAPVSRAAVGLPEHAIVLAAIHQPYKLEPGILGCWFAILRAAPSAVLWIRAVAEELQGALRQAATAAGVDPERLIFARPCRSKHDHLARLALADVFLDTRWFNGHSTVSDALWAGVPVVTLEGDAFHGRVASSILHAAGLAEWATREPEVYVARVARLAHCPGERARAREQVRAARAGPGFFDNAAHTRRLESALRAMVARAQAGLAPADLDFT